MRNLNARSEEKISVAPMMGYTDRHARYLMRLLTKNTVLYTEMITAQAIAYCQNHRSLLACDPSENPVVVQLGGADADLLGNAVDIVQNMYSYDEINFNMGCPSQRVQSGCFGAALMKDLSKARHCLQAMQQKARIPITVKCRIGVDDYEGEDFFYSFMDMIQQIGIKKVVVHARKAYLQGLDPKKNRTIPPLNYDFVYQVKNHFSDMKIIMNGGIGFDQIDEHLRYVDGVMIGRAAFDDMTGLAQIDRQFFDQESPVSHLAQIMQSYLEYMKHEMEQGTHMRALLKPIFSLYKARKGTRKMRHTLHSIFQLAVKDKKKSLHMLETCVLD